jgi:cyclase
VRVVPCLDVSGGRVVKGVRFAGLVDAGDPVELARRYEAAGADELVLLDVSATLEERDTSRACVAAVRAVLAVPLTVGGGVRDLRSARALLAAGADKVAVNSAAVERPELVRELAQAFGSQAVVLAVDAVRRTDGGWRVAVRSATQALELDALAWIERGAALGAGEILLTSVDRDGTGSGFDLELLAAARARVAVPIVASGGARGPADLVLAARAGATGLLAAGMFHRGEVALADCKRALASAGEAVRP